MNVQMLGTGNAFAKKYFNTNALFYIEGRTVMLDCGITAPLSLYQLNKTFNDIDALLVSHIHADHIGGIEEFAFQMKFVHKRKPLLYVPPYLLKRFGRPLSREACCRMSFSPWMIILKSGCFMKG